MSYSAPSTIAGIVDHRARTARLQWLALAVVASVACGVAAVLSIAVARPQLCIATVADLVAAARSTTPPLQNFTIESPVNAGSGYSPTETTSGLSIDDDDHSCPSSSVLQTSGGGRSLPPSFGTGGILTGRQFMMDTDAKIRLKPILVSHGSALTDALMFPPDDARISGTLILSSNGCVNFKWDDSLHGLSVSVAVYLVQCIKLAYARTTCIPAMREGRPVTLRVRYQCWFDRINGCAQTVSE